MIKIEGKNLKEFLEPIVWTDTKNGYHAVFKNDLIGILPYRDGKITCGEATDFALLNGASNFYGTFNWSRTAEFNYHFNYSTGNITQISSIKRSKPQNEKPYTSHIGTSPYIHLNVQKVVEYLKEKGEDSPTIHDINGDSRYILFGEYPQTLASRHEMVWLESLFSKMHIAEISGTTYQPKDKEDEIIETGKNYLLSVEYDDDRKVVGVRKGQEILFQNEKYVKVLRRNFHLSSHEVLSNGKAIKDSVIHKKTLSDIFFFVKVLPIKWKILNWEALPKEINPLGKGTAKYIECMTEKTIIGELPFHPIVNDERNALFQNSTVRAYLNGINVEDSKYIDKPWWITGGGNFEAFKSSFLQEAFSDSQFEIKMDQQTGAVKYSKKRARGYGLKLKKNMSVDEQIKYYIKSGKSFMLHGPSGVGKSRRVAEADPNFVSIILRNGMLPEEIIGKTIYRNEKDVKSGEWVPPAWYKKLCDLCENEPEKNHVLFIDEITNVKPSEQSLVFHLVLNHSIGPNIGKLPQNAVVVAAGNAREESEAAYNMPEPLFRRFDGHIQLKPNYLDFISWGSKLNENGRPKIHPIITSYLGAFGNTAFYSSYNAEEPPEFAIDPRGWEQVSEMIYKNDGEVVFELLENKIGTNLATSLWGFMESPLITVEDVVEGVFTIEDIPEKYDEKYALALSLQSVDEENVQKVRKFIATYLSKELLSVFDAVWVGNDNERALILNNFKKNKNELCL